MIKGHATYFLEPDVDTDIIIPARFLKRTSLGGFEPFSFFERRYLPSTICEPTMEQNDFVFQKKEINPDFIPNHPNCADATFLLTWLNFGCGSSREHAVYSLLNYRVIIGSAPKGKAAFADIFRDNCRQNLIWTPVLKEEDHKILSDFLQKEIKNRKVTLILDPKNLTLSDEDKNFNFNFEIPENHLTYLLGEEKNPFAIAQREIEADIKEIEDWSQKNQATVKKYPTTANAS